ncbi:hypothetical protein SDC9_72623 [bioreactor metagenome]|uniref:Uncharacterized protein n=1 Tax=bioreactor metagenome TaxID=1076179 RepID=A0A644YBW6_9ZZZZ
MILDFAVVLTGLILSLAFLHRVDGIREGTVIAALVTGKVIAPIKRLLFPVMRGLCFPSDTPEIAA